MDQRGQGQRGGRPLAGAGAHQGDDGSGPDPAGGRHCPDGGSEGRHEQDCGDELQNDDEP